MTGAVAELGERLEKEAVSERPPADTADTSLQTVLKELELEIKC